VCVSEMKYMMWLPAVSQQRVGLDSAPIKIV